MAYAALVSLAQTIDLILNHDKYSINVDEKERIKSIHEYVSFLISFLEEFPEKANRLEGKIRDVANQTEDILEYFTWNQIQSRYQGMVWSSGGISRVEFEHHLKKVTEEIGLIAGDIMDVEFSSGLKDVRLNDSRTASSNNIVVGFDEDLRKIKDLLCGESSQREVIPIVGMGGIGKTALAKNAYDDPLITWHFQIRAWVTVSQNYSAQKMLSSLLDSIEGCNVERFGQDNVENMHKTLKGRRYLIVMDDMWSTKAWDDVNKAFPDDHNGSRIMLTTRLSDVAAYPNSSLPPHEMRLMDLDQSWNLLKQKVFTNGQDCPSELEDVGKEIARSCRGLPLAVVLVAGILSTVIKTRALWEEIAKNVNLVVDGHLEKILSLSYTHLPHHLRPCFLFIGGFPEDHKIHVSKLIKLWVAEGFLKRQNECKSLEDEAEECLEDLVKRNLVLVTSRKTNGKIKSCSLHDLVRDLCIRKAQDEKFLQHIMRRHVPPESIKNDMLLTDIMGTDILAESIKNKKFRRHIPPESIKNERRISIYHSHLINIWGPTIHTIVCFLVQKGSSSLPILGRFRLLRVLDMVDVVSGLFSYSQVPIVLPSQVFELFHLRYLALADYFQIPSAISNLDNLQTLIIHPSIRVDLPTFYHCSTLPLEIWRMPQLRHLVFYYFYMLPDPAHGSTLPLQNLQTLSGVYCLVCSENILKMIRNIKKLAIKYSYNSVNQEYHLHNLIYLHRLEKLRVAMPGNWHYRGQNPAFPRTLKMLTLFGGRFPWKVMTAIVGSLPNLEVLKLGYFACHGDTWETSDGEFPQLKLLLILNLDFQHWITESSHFPRLKCLVLKGCPYLREIPDCVGEIPTLELIEVSKYDKRLVDSARQIQEDQQSYGNDALQVRCVHFTSVGYGLWLVDVYKKSRLILSDHASPEETAGIRTMTKI